MERSTSELPPHEAHSSTTIACGGAGVAERVRGGAGWQGVGWRLQARRARLAGWLAAAQAWPCIPAMRSWAAGQLPGRPRGAWAVLARLLTLTHLPLASSLSPRTRMHLPQSPSLSNTWLGRAA